MINIPRGQGVLVHGIYSIEDEGIDINIHDDEPGFTISESTLTAPKGFN